MLELLNDAVWAPFHSSKEPWRFLLFMGEGRKAFADAVMRAHLLVVIEADPRQKHFEDAFSAAAALIQNVQLLAWEKQIGVVWKTNDYNWHPKFLQAVGVKPGERVVGTLHLGYFHEEKTPRPRKRTPVTELLTEFHAHS